jgi:hypothetical protein
MTEKAKLNVVPHPRASWSDKVAVDEAMEQLNEHWKAGRLQHLLYACIDPNGDTTYRFTGNMRMHHIGLALGFLNADYHRQLMICETTPKPYEPVA